MSDLPKPVAWRRRWPVVIFFGLILATGGLMIAGLIHEAKTWAKFKEEHHCKIVGKQSGDIIPMFGTDGKFSIGTTSSKTGWACDDGVTYWR